MSLSKTKKELAQWIERDNAKVYACKLYQLRITIAEALSIMSTIQAVGWRYQEDVVREMIRLEGGSDAIPWCKRDGKDLEAGI